MDRDLGKLLYQVLAMQYRDLVRPHMTGAKSVVDDFDLDRVCVAFGLWNLNSKTFVQKPETYAFEFFPAVIVIFVGE